MNSSFTIGWPAKKSFLLFVLTVTGCLYINFFEVSLADGYWLSVDGFSRIVIPDTFLYSDIIDVNNVITSLAESGVKNALVPALIWYAVGFDWYLTFFLNIFLIYCCTLYMKGLAKQYGISVIRARSAVVVFLIMPTTIYYAIGALKELPMMLGFLAILYHYNSRNFKAVLLAALFLVATRYQLAFVVLLLIFISRFRNPIRVACGAMLGVSAIFPLIGHFDILSAANVQEFRFNYGASGSFGERVEFVRDNFYFLSAFSVVIRVFQSLFEPIIGLVHNFSFYEDGDLSIYRIVSVISNCFCAPYIALFVIKLKDVVLACSRINKEVQLIYATLVVSLIIIGGFSFIHGRYLVPFIPMIIVAGLIPLNRIREDCGVVQCSSGSTAVLPQSPQFPRT